MQSWLAAPSLGAAAQVSVSPAAWVGAHDALLVSGYLVLEPVTNGNASASADAATTGGQPPLYIPYLALTAQYTDLPVLLPGLAGGMRDPSGSWWWDTQVRGRTAHARA